jgi:hypothetical protein
MTDRRLATLHAALGFLELPPRAPELRLLHRWLDSWMGVGLIHRRRRAPGLPAVAQPYADGQWRAQLSAHPLWSSVGYGVAATPWEATRIATAAPVRRGCMSPPRDWQRAIVLQLEAHKGTPSRSGAGRRPARRC